MLNKRDTYIGLVTGGGLLVSLFGIYDFPWWIDWPWLILCGTPAGFIAAVRAKQVIEHEDGAWWTPFVAWLVPVVLVLDFGWNMTVGVGEFGEFERILFSHRIQDRVDDMLARGVEINERGYPTANTQRLMDDDDHAALKWARRLNVVDKGHIRFTLSR